MCVILREHVGSCRTVVMAAMATFSNLCRLSLLLILSIQLLERNDHDIEENALLSKKVVGLATKIEAILGSPRRKRFYTSRITYYAASTASFQLEHITLSGDVNPNPGPIIPQNHHGDEFHIIPGNGLKIGRWNVSNLTDKKLEQIKLLLSSNEKIDLLFLIETFLTSKKPDSLLAINGYNIIRKDRAGSQKGGGSLAYINESLKDDRIESLEDDALETLWLQVSPHKSKRPIPVGAVYRPPSTTVAIDTASELNIEAVYLRKQEMYLRGDFNINYLDTATYQNHRLIRALKSLSLSQVISSVTRPKSSTFLDHLYTTHPSFIAGISVPNIGMSDHLPAFFRRKYTRNKRDGKHKFIKYRDYKNLNKDNLRHDLENASWDTAFESKCVDEVLD